MGSNSRASLPIEFHESGWGWANNRACTSACINMVHPDCGHSIYDGREIIILKRGINVNARASIMVKVDGWLSGVLVVVVVVVVVAALVLLSLEVRPCCSALRILGEPPCLSRQQTRCRQASLCREEFAS